MDSAGDGASDSGGDPEAARVLLLGAGRQGVVEGPELCVHLGGEVVEDLLPGRRLVVAAGQQQLPGVRLAVALTALRHEVRQVAVLRGRLLLRGGARRQRFGVAPLEDADDGLDHFRSHLAHVLPPLRWTPHAGPSPAAGRPTACGAGCRTRARPSPRAVPRTKNRHRDAGRPTPPGTIAVHWRIRLVAYGARLESGLGATPREFESPILRR